MKIVAVLQLYLLLHSLYYVLYSNILHIYFQLNKDNLKFNKKCIYVMIKVCKKVNDSNDRFGRLNLIKAKHNKACVFTFR